MTIAQLHSISCDCPRVTYRGTEYRITATSFAGIPKVRLAESLAKANGTFGLVPSGWVPLSQVERS